MKQPSNKTQSPNTWKGIQKNTAPRTLTGISKKRRTIAMFKTIAIIVLVSLCAYAAFEIYTTWQKDPVQVKAPVKSEPLKTITLRNPDGVLDHAWVTQTLALPKNIGMMELDIVALRARLLDNPQVRLAVLARQFPSTLTITIEERKPIARIRVQQTPETIDELLIATDGVVFAGTNFSKATLAALPYLSEVPLVRTAPGSSQFAPIEGIEIISQFIETARTNIPNLYATWKSISLKRYASDRVIIVHAANSLQIIFGTHEFYEQIAQLDYIIDHQQSTSTTLNAQPQPRTIDLSVGKTASGVLVPVTFASDTTPPPAPPRRPR